MPAKSESQARLFRMAYAVRKGKIKRSEVEDSVLDLADSKISDKDLKEFFNESIVDFLNEALITEKHIDTLYHFSSIYGALDVMYKDEFKLNVFESDINHKLLNSLPKDPVKRIDKLNHLLTKQLNYMSCTRWKQIGGYSSKIYDDDGIVVRFTLDGNKLTTNYKVVPIQYVAFDNHAGAPNKDGRHYNRLSDENHCNAVEWTTKVANNFWDQREERLISKDDIIRDFSKYVKDVDILIPADIDLMDSVGPDELRNIGQIVQNYPKEIHVYSDKNQFNNKTKKFVDLYDYVYKHLRP